MLSLRYLFLFAASRKSGSTAKQSKVVLSSRSRSYSSQLLTAADRSKKDALNMIRELYQLSISNNRMGAKSLKKGTSQVGSKG